MDQQTITVTTSQKRLLLDALNSRIGETLRLQAATDDGGLKDLLELRLQDLRATYLAVQEAA